MQEPAPDCSLHIAFAPQGDGVQGDSFSIRIATIRYYMRCIHIDFNNLSNISYTIIINAYVLESHIE